MKLNEVGAGLAPEELAFYFSCENGVEAKALGAFLSRASTVAKNRGAILQVTATHDGSLVVVARVLEGVRGAIGKEFASSPIQATAASTMLVGAVVAGLSSATSPDEMKVSPLAKANIDLIENHDVELIQLVTSQASVLMMDRKKAAKLRGAIQNIELAEEVYEFPALDFPGATLFEHPSRLEDRMLVDKARRGELTGVAIFAGTELHFRPDGYRYLVPVEYDSNYSDESLSPSKHYRVRGAIKFQGALPESVVIEAASVDER
ncbi:hypothetical protein [Sulfitobacter sp. PS-8MA]|uniref:hypothetical protein n=1 Tax=Sulfitobacter sp. PS-8MA TaxID=3237707 RepID=UPI0034C64A11